MRKRVAVVLVAAWVLACGAPRPRPPSGPAALTLKGRVENGPFVFGREDLARLPRRAFRAEDPRSGRTVLFEGISLAPVLSDEMTLARGADTAAVRGGDGYLATVPLSAIRQLRPVLADRADGQPLPALRLVWPNLDWPGLETDPRPRFWWVDGVVDVDLLGWERSFGTAMRLPAGANDAARRGADEFANLCLSCHRLRGVGGERGADLTAAARRFGGPRLLARVRAHGAREASRLGAPAPLEGALAAVTAFLAAVDAAGPVPVQEEKREDDLLGQPRRRRW